MHELHEICLCKDQKCVFLLIHSRVAYVKFMKMFILCIYYLRDMVDTYVAMSDFTITYYYVQIILLTQMLRGSDTVDQPSVQK